MYMWYPVLVKVYRIFVDEIGSQIECDKSSESLLKVYKLTVRSLRNLYEVGITLPLCLSVSRSFIAATSHTQHVYHSSHFV